MSELAANIARMATVMTNATRAMGRVWQNTRESMLALERVLRIAANNEVQVSGLEARFYARGSMGHLIGESIDDVVQALMAKQNGGFPMALLTLETRARLAAAALRGYVESVPGDAPTSLAWHRAYGSMLVSVGREA